MNHFISPEQLLGQLHWRYATKQFDTARKIEPQLWSSLEDALVLSPSSGGLQPWTFVVVDDQATREKLLPASFDQAQVPARGAFTMRFELHFPISMRSFIGKPQKENWSRRTRPTTEHIVEALWA
jgi:nitroreductase